MDMKTMMDMGVDKEVIQKAINRRLLSLHGADVKNQTTEEAAVKLFLKSDKQNHQLRQQLKLLTSGKIEPSSPKKVVTYLIKETKSSKFQTARLLRGLQSLKFVPTSTLKEKTGAADLKKLKLDTNKKINRHGAKIISDGHGKQWKYKLEISYPLTILVSLSASQKTP